MAFKNLPLFEKKQGVNIYRIQCLRKKKEICETKEMASFVINALPFILKLAQKEKYNLCHTHFLIPSGILALILKKRLGLPFIITAHGSDVPQFNPDRFILEHYFTKPLLQLICRNANQIVSPSYFLKKLIQKNIGHYNIKIIPHAIDFQESPNFQKKEKIVLATGRLLPRKGFHYLVKGFKQTKSNWQLHIAGDGPYMAKIKKLAADDRRIKLHGWLDNQSRKYQQLYQKASIFVLASEKENFSVSLLEAMRAGCAVITTNVSGCPEVINKTGIIIKPRSPEAIKQALEYLFQNKKEVIKYGRRAYKRVISKYNWEHIVAQYLICYQKIINEGF